jgi:hypothetical protein
MSLAFLIESPQFFSGKRKCKIPKVSTVEEAAQQILSALKLETLSVEDCLIEIYDAAWEEYVHLETISELKDRSKVRLSSAQAANEQNDKDISREKAPVAAPAAKAPAAKAAPIAKAQATLAPAPAAAAPAAATKDTDPSEHFRKKLLVIYTQHNPAKIGDVEGLVLKYRGQEVEALKLVRDKYQAQSEANEKMAKDRKQTEEAKEKKAKEATEAKEAKEAEEAEAKERAAKESAVAKSPAPASTPITELAELEGQLLAAVEMEDYDRAAAIDEKILELKHSGASSGETEDPTPNQAPSPVDTASRSPVAAPPPVDVAPDSDVSAFSFINDSGSPTDSSNSPTNGHSGNRSAAAGKKIAHNPAKSYSRRLAALLREHNPSKLPEVDSLLAKYKGAEEGLLQAVAEKYAHQHGRSSPTSPTQTTAVLPEVVRARQLRADTSKSRGRPGKTVRAGVWGTARRGTGATNKNSSRATAGASSSASPPHPGSIGALPLRATWGVGGYSEGSAASSLKQMPSSLRDANNPKEAAAPAQNHDDQLEHEEQQYINTLPYATTIPAALASRYRGMGTGELKKLLGKHAVPSAAWEQCLEKSELVAVLLRAPPMERSLIGVLRNPGRLLAFGGLLVGKGGGAPQLLEFWLSAQAYRKMAELYDSTAELAVAARRIYETYLTSEAFMRDQLAINDPKKRWIGCMWGKHVPLSTECSQALEMELESIGAWKSVARIDLFDDAAGEAFEAMEQHLAAFLAVIDGHFSGGKGGSALRLSLAKMEAAASAAADAGAVNEDAASTDIDPVANDRAEKRAVQMKELKLARLQLYAPAEIAAETAGEDVPGRAAAAAAAADPARAVLQLLINLMVHHQIQPCTVQDLISR